MQSGMQLLCSLEDACAGAWQFYKVRHVITSAELWRRAKALQNPTLMISMLFPLAGLKNKPPLSENFVCLNLDY